VRRRAEPELEPMPATLTALPSHGRWMDAGWGLGVPRLPLVVVGHKRAKARSNQAWAAPAGPVRPITDQRPEPPGPRAALKAARAGVRLDTLGRGKKFGAALLQTRVFAAPHKMEDRPHTQQQ
jgi:hypothetical protein